MTNKEFPSNNSKVFSLEMFVVLLVQFKSTFQSPFNFASRRLEDDMSCDSVDIKCHIYISKLK